MFARVFAIVAYVIGLAGAAAFYLFILATGVGLLERKSPSDGVTPWAINVGLLLLFALQHSGMARQSFKAWIVKLVPASLERSTYVAASGVVTIVLVCAWQPLPGAAIWHGPLWIVALSLLAACGLAYCACWFDHNTFFGLTQAWRGEAELSGPLCIEGPYRYVRHPLMLAVLMAIWSQPIMPPELMLLNAGMTLYVLVAIVLEERDLVRVFGEPYERYRKEVPMLIPFWNRLFP